MKYKINKNQAPLTDGDLASARNFNTVIKGYRSMKIPFYRSGKFLTRGSAIIVAVAVALIVLFDEKAEKPKDFISPPFAQAVIPADSYTVDADSATEIDYKSGSKLHIPAAAFRDADGKPVSGKVILKYREFHDQKDIFLSGIPMTYDSAGQTYVFESAGMMEISAFQNGKPLTVTPDHPIRVEMVSNTAEDRYNTYYLDTAAKKWVNLNQANLVPVQVRQMRRGKDSNLLGNATVAEEESDSTSPVLIKFEDDVKKTTAAVKAIEKEKPITIAHADKTKSKFHIIVDPVQFPEIAMYKDVRFQVKDEKNFDRSSANVDWEDVKLKKMTGLDYEITFGKGDRSFKVIATPVLDDRDIPAAQKIYDKKFAEYQSKLSQRKAAEEKAKKEYEEQVKIYAEQNRKYEASLNKTNLIYRTFTVNRFGFYNCDCPRQSPSDVDVTAIVTDENNVPLNLTELCLVEKNINMVCSYHSVNRECKHFKFNSTQDNVLWAVTSDNKLAIIDVTSFKAQQSKTGKVAFKFKVIDKEFKSCDEVKKYLEI